MKKMLHNAKKTCWNCPAAKFKGNVDFRSCGQTKEEIKKRIKDDPNFEVLIECKRRPELGHFEPSITFEQCPEWIEGPYGYMLKKMRIMILGIDGYLGWTLALKLGKLGFDISGVDNYIRRDMIMEKGAHTIVPISRMTERLHVAKEILGIDINFRRIDVRKEPEKLREFIEEFKPESIIHYGEVPSAPYSMVDVNHAVFVQDNNVLGTLELLFIMRDIIPETCLIKLGTIGEYGSPLTGRPLFEGFFPSDAVLKWNDREWSLGGELTPREPRSFYHVSKVQDTYNVYEACKYWWLRSYDIMQGVIFGIHTDETAADPRLRTRFDIDEWFGTVLNRFIAQAILGIPLTIYGEGDQLRGALALDDAMQCMVRLIVSPPEPGQYDTVNQLTAIYKIKDIAEVVAKIGKEFGLNVKIQRLENPRLEADRHPMEIVSKKLEENFGLKAKIKLEDEIRRVFKLLLQPECKKRIEQKKHVIMPKTTWSGIKKDMDILEEYKPGTKKPDIKLKQQLDRIDGIGVELSSIETKEHRKKWLVPSTKINSKSKIKNKRR